MIYTCGAEREIQIYNGNKKRVYADNAATTAVLPEVVEAMLPCFNKYWGNPSSLHDDGQRAKEILDASRQKIADIFECNANEIYFTSCGTESDNWAIKGAARAARNGRKKIVTSKIEHHAVLHTCEALEKEGFEVTYVGVDSKGIINMNELRAAVDDNTIIVAVMLANNEIGTIQPIKEIAEIAHAHGALMFTDAVQAVGAIPVKPKDLGVDMFSMSGHKLGAPKGIGLLYIRKGVNIANLVEGGGQERGHRGGTENLPYIVGLAKALELAIERMPDNERIRKMRDRLIDGLTALPYSALNGDREKRLPGNVNVSFDFVEGESFMLWLNLEGISVSTGSACSSKSLDPSHVLLATGVDVEKAHGSLRFSLSHANTDEDVDYILKVVPEVLEKLRKMSPIYPG